MVTQPVGARDCLHLVYVGPELISINGSGPLLISGDVTQPLRKVRTFPR